VLCAKAARRVRQSRSVQFLGEPIQWVEKARYLGVLLDTRLTWSAHVNHLRKKASRILGPLAALHNSTSGLSVRCCVLLHKQLTRLTMDYAWPIRKSTARSHVQKLQVLQSKCLLIATNVPYTFIIGKFTRFLGFHSSPSTSLIVSTRIYPMRGTTYFGYLEDICADRGLTDVPRVTKVN
jgi:hypothetical protein